MIFSVTENLKRLVALLEFKFNTTMVNLTECETRKYHNISRVLKSIYSGPRCSTGYKSDRDLQRDKEKETRNIMIFPFPVVTYFSRNGYSPGTRVAKSISRGLRITRTEDGIYVYSPRQRECLPPR